MMRENGPDLCSLAGKRVTVIGLGVEGISLVRYFVAHGANVTISDLKSPEQLQDRLAVINGLPVHLALKGNDPAVVRDAAVVFVSQGVPLSIPAVQKARALGIPISSVTQFFLRRWRGPVAAITGSSGKTTTTSLVHAMFNAAGREHVLAGNIGEWPLERLDQPSEGIWAVMEISHTQLQITDRSPNVACITNITPNHLDRFTWEEYVALKRNLIRYQGPTDWAVLNYDNPEGWAAQAATAGRVFAFSRRGLPPGDAAYLADGIAWLRLNGEVEPLFAVEDVRLRGVHNLENCLAAAAVARLCGIEAAAIREALQHFWGVPHRLEFVAEIAGVAYYNDSIATTPERTLAGMRSFDQPLVLLLGGRDKHLPLEELVQECYRRCRSVILFGEAAELLERSFQANQPPDGWDLPVRRVLDLEEAVAEARRLAQPGDIVLLSPACTSFDAYNNFEQRGAHFRALVQALAGCSVREERHE